MKEDATQGRDRFYLLMSIVLAAIVFVGFTPTLFGRAMFSVPPMPAYLYLHGMVLATWYTMVVVQAALIGARRPVLHRQLGWATVIFAVAVPVAGMGTQLAIPDRLRAAGIDITPYTGVIEAVFWSNVASTLLFTGLLIAATLLRKRSETHKRLMLFASIALIPPAAARLARWPIFGNTNADLSQPGGPEMVFAAGSLVLLAALVVIHDLARQRRLHPATIVGGGILIVVSFVAPAIAQSAWGKEIVWALS